MSEKSKGTGSGRPSIRGVELTNGRIGHIVFALGFLFFTLFVFAGAVGPLWEWFFMNLNHRFSMFIGFVGCFLVLVGIPVKLALMLGEKRDLKYINGLPAWVTVTSVWNLVVLVILQFAYKGGVPGLVGDRGAWLPSQMFGQKSFITRTLHETLGLGGVIGFNAPVVVNSQVLAELRAAASEEDYKAKIEAMIDEHPGLLRYRKEGGLNEGLLSVIYSHDAKAVEFFATHIDLSEVDAEGNTILHAMAAKPSEWKIFKALVDAGADYTTRNTAGQTPVHVAAQHDNYAPSIDYVLSKQADINMLNEQGQTPLHVAAVNHAGDVVALLVARGADLTLKDQAELTPLEAAKKARTEFATQQGQNLQSAERFFSSTFFALEHADQIRKAQTAAEWKALQSSKGTMWYYDPSSWEWKGSDIEFKFQLREGEEVKEDRVVRLSKQDGTWKLHPSHRRGALSRLTDGARTTLNDQISQLPETNVPRIDPRWTANKDYDWSQAFPER